MCSHCELKRRGIEAGGKAVVLIRYAGNENR